METYVGFGIWFIENVSSNKYNHVNEHDINIVWKVCLFAVWHKCEKKVNLFKDSFHYSYIQKNDEIKHVETLRYDHFNKTKKGRDNLAWFSLKVIWNVNAKKKSISVITQKFHGGILNW